MAIDDYTAFIQFMTPGICRFCKDEVTDAGFFSSIYMHGAVEVFRW